MDILIIFLVCMSIFFTIYSFNHKNRKGFLIRTFALVNHPNSIKIQNILSVLLSFLSMLAAILIYFNIINKLFAILIVLIAYFCSYILKKTYSIKR